MFSVGNDDGSLYDAKKKSWMITKGNQYKPVVMADAEQYRPWWNVMDTSTKLKKVTIMMEQKL